MQQTQEPKTPTNSLTQLGSEILELLIEQGVQNARIDNALYNATEGSLILLDSELIVQFLQREDNPDLFSAVHHLLNTSIASTQFIKKSIISLVNTCPHSHANFKIDQAIITRVLESHIRMTSVANHLLTVGIEIPYQGSKSIQIISKCFQALDLEFSETEKLMKHRLSYLATGRLKQEEVREICSYIMEQSFGPEYSFSVILGAIKTRKNVL